MGSLAGLLCVYIYAWEEVLCALDWLKNVPRITKPKMGEQELMLLKGIQIVRAHFNKDVTSKWATDWIPFKNKSLLNKREIKKLIRK